MEIEGLLQKRAEEGNLRSLRPVSNRKAGSVYIGGKEYIDLSSNDYLGLSHHPRLLNAAKEALEKFGASSSASRLLSGDLEMHHRLEESVATFKGKESALVFNSGYQANIGIISSFCSKSDAIFSDKANHASIVDGMILSGAKIFRFLHNDPSHLETLLKANRKKFKNALIVTEGIFSMDGDRAPLKALVELKERYGCRLMVDEAHATGIYGPTGAGVIEEEGFADSVDLVMGTFGKALGSFGAYLATSKTITEYLINTCRAFIYSTALPPAIIAADIASLEVIKDEPFRRRDLLKAAGAFRSRLKGAGLAVRGDSQIVPVIIGGNPRTVEIASALQSKGYWVLPIRPPTVPAGEARLRFSITFDHGEKTLNRLADDIIGIGI